MSTTDPLWQLLAVMATFQILALLGAFVTLRKIRLWEAEIAALPDDPYWSQWDIDAEFPPVDYD
jgi:hypothetical protein